MNWLLIQRFVGTSCWRIFSSTCCKIWHLWQSFLLYLPIHILGTPIWFIHNYELNRLNTHTFWSSWYKVIVNSRVVGNELNWIYKISNCPYPGSHARNESKVLSGFTRPQVLTIYKFCPILRTTRKNVLKGYGMTLLILENSGF